MRYLVIVWLFLAGISTQAQAQCSVKVASAGICLGASTTLTAVVTGNTGAVTYTWTPTTNINPTNTANPVANPGSTETYTVTVNGGGCTNVTATATVTVNDPPTAAFTITDNNVCASTPVSFTNSSSGAATYGWYFGDPNSGSSDSSTSASPSHTFDAPGNGTQSFNVKLVAISAAGCKDSVTQTVTVKQVPDPTLDDYVDNPPLTNCGNGTFNMAVDNGSTTQATNTDYFFAWGDGTTTDTTVPVTFAEIIHSYTSLGYFNLAYTVTGQNGCTNTEDYTVFNGSNPAGGLENPGNTTNLCPPATITMPITGTSVNPPGTLYTISINDGSPKITYTQPPPTSFTHTFTTTSCGATGGIVPNSFVVTLTIVNPCGTSYSEVEPITLSSQPVSKFTFSPDSIVCVNSPVSVTNTSTAAVTINVAGNCTPGSKLNWLINPTTGWNTTFGTQLGSDPPTANPATWGSNTLDLNFTTPGVYNISLITEASGTNPCGIDTITKPICVQTKPQAAYTLSATTGCTPFNVTATDNTVNTNSCGYIKYHWVVNFDSSQCSYKGKYAFTNGGATPDSAQNPTFVFDSAGVYQIIENVITGCGFTSDTQVVTVKATAFVGVNPIPDTCGSADNINPTDTILSCFGTISAYNWTFTGGTPSTSTSNNPGTIAYSGQGNYTVTLGVTDECGTTNASASFEIGAGPTGNAGNDTSICLGRNVTLGGKPTASAGNGTFTYSWSPGNHLNDSTIANPLAAPTTTSTYVLSLGSNGCTVSDTITVTVDSIPDITVNSPHSCKGKSDTLIATNGVTYVWSPATNLNISTGDTVIASLTTSASYTVTGTDGNGCSSGAISTVTVNPVTTPNAGPNQSFCNQNIPVTLTGTPVGGTWSGTGITKPTGTFNPDTAGVGSWPLVYAYTNGFGCVGTDTMIATVIAVTPANAGNGFPVCVTTASVNLTTLGATPAGGSWSGHGVTGNFFSPSGVGVGSDTLTYSEGTNTCLVSDTVIITVIPLPTVTVNSDSICFGKSVTLIATGAVTYSWAPNTNLNATTGDTVIANPTASSVYTVTGTSIVAGCSRSANATVTVDTLPVPNAGPDQSFCDQGIPVAITGTPAGGTWSGNGVSSNGIFNPSSVGIGSYPLVYTVTNSFGCVGTDTMIATVANPTPANAGTGYPVCVGEGTVSLNTLGATPAGGIWSGRGVSGTNLDPTVAGLGPDTLTYSWGTGTCFTTDSAIMTVLPQPTVTATSLDSICLGQSATLVALGTVNYAWSPNTNLNTTTDSTVIATPVQSVTYTVVGTDGNGCTASATSTVVVKPLPVVIAGSNLTLCAQPIPDTLQGFSPTTGGTGVWSGSPTVTPAGIYTPGSPGTVELYYTFTSSTIGCSNKDSISVTLNTADSAKAGINDSICVGAPAAPLTGFSPPGGVWSGNGIINAATGFFDPSVAGVGVDSLYYTYGSGTCFTSALKIRMVLPVPVYTFTPPNPVTCALEPITLSISGNASYTWSPASVLNTATGNTVIATLYADTAFTIVAVDPYGCNATLNITVIVNPLPHVSAGSDTALCNQNRIPITLTGSPAGGFWTGNLITANGVFTASGIPADTGIYTVTYHYIDNNGCNDSASTHVHVAATIYANAGPNDTLCLNSAPVTLQGFSPPTGGIWSGRGITDSLTGVFNPRLVGDGAHPLYYSYGAGSCATEDSMIVFVRDTPHPSFVYAPVCIGQLTVFEDNSTYVVDNIVSWLWNFGDGSSIRSRNPTHNFAQNGNYNVELTVTDDKGCTADTIIPYLASPSPVVKFVSPPEGCLDTLIYFFVPNANDAEYYWTFGDGSSDTVATPAHAYTATGTYTIKLIGTSENGCMDSSSAQITVGPSPVANFTLDPKTGCGPLKVLYHYIPGDFPNLDYDFTWTTGNGDTLYDPLPDTVVYQPDNETGDTSYVVTLYVQSRACLQIAVHTDTVHVINGPEARITTPTTNTCPGVTLTFNISGLGNIFGINFGDGDTTAVSSPQPIIHSFQNASDKDTTYKVLVTAFSNCGSASDSVSITVHAGRVKAGMTITPESNCMGIPFTLTNTSQGGSYIYYALGTGKPGANSNVLPQFTFSIADSGQYTISQYVYSSDSCSSDTASVQVGIHSPPKAAFIDTPTSKECEGAVMVSFINQSTNASSYMWQFGDNTPPSVDENPMHDFPNAGMYQVQLMAASPYGCLDTSTSNITLVHNEDGLYVPNAFSPTYGTAEVRMFKPAGLCLATYSLQIFDTWGQLLWETTQIDNQQPAQGWDGTFNGNLLPQGVYVWKIEATFTDNNIWPGKDYDGTYKKIGTVTLLR